MGKYTKLAFTVNIVIFSFIFLLHLIRIIFSLEISSGSWYIPMWASYIGLIISAVIIFLNYKGL